MYTVIIGVPFRPGRSGVAEVASDWAESLLLLRDSLRGRFGPITVAAPRMPPGDGLITEQVSRELAERADGIRFVALGDTRWRARHFWRNCAEIRGRCDRLAASSDVVHAGISNLWQPYSYFGFRAGYCAGRCTVFVQDGDAIQRAVDLTRSSSTWVQWKTTLYNRLYYEMVRRAVACADLSLLKGRQLHLRYGRFAKNAKNFYNTSFRKCDIIPARELSAKCADLLSGGLLRCLCLGRLASYKGIDHGIRAVDRAVRQGARIQFDIIGGGPDEGRLRALVAEIGAEQHVRFLGLRPYGAVLLQEIRKYHILLFTSLAEETPRSVFDGLAAGCGLVAFKLPYTQQLIDEFGHGRIVSRGSVEEFAGCLCELHRDRNLVVRWMRKAAHTAVVNSAEVWYQRRAEWTVEAFEKRNTNRLSR